MTCPRCGREGLCGDVFVPGDVRVGDREPALRFGQNGYLCRCGAPAIFEWSPGQYACCSKACLQAASKGRYPLAVVA